MQMKCQYGSGYTISLHPNAHHAVLVINAPGKPINTHSIGLTPDGLRELAQAMMRLADNVTPA